MLQEQIITSEQPRFGRWNVQADMLYWLGELYVHSACQAIQTHQQLATVKLQILFIHGGDPPY